MANAVLKGALCGEPAVTVRVGATATLASWVALLPLKVGAPLGSETVAVPPKVAS